MPPGDGGFSVLTAEAPLLISAVTVLRTCETAQGLSEGDETKKSGFPREAAGG